MYSLSTPTSNDTYAIIPSVNVETRISELDNVELWAMLVLMDIKDDMQRFFGC